jgi:hypothetical protein
VSPTLTGIAVKILPIETLCKPTILISVIKNSSNAEVENDINASRERAKFFIDDVIKI